MGLIRDLRYAVRTLVKSPGFTAAAALTLALGIAANTVIFSLADAVLLRPLPYRKPESLVVLWEGRHSRPQERNVISAANFLDWKSQARGFEDMALSTWSGVTLVGSGTPERLAGRAVTANLFSVLGVAPALGRTFSPSEEAPGGPDAIVLSHGLWMRRFGGDPGIVGRPVRTGDGSALVVGVMPRSFRPLGTEEYWEPFRFSQEALNNWGRFAIGWARVRPGVSVAAAQQEMSLIARRLERVRPQFDSGWGVRVVPIAEDVSGGAQPLLLVLAGAVVLLFLLACANVANLLFGRALAREKETAIRRALGASGARIARQWVAEGLLLAFAGCAAGLAAAAWGLHAVVAAAAGRVPRLEEAALSGRSVIFAAAVSAAVGLAFGLLPGTRRRAAISASLSGADRVTAGKSAASWKGALAASQIAIALVLLTGAGLLVRSLERLGQVEPGFDPSGVLTFRMTLPENRYSTGERQNLFFEDLTATVRRLPGVRAAGVVNTPPMTGFGPGTSFQVEDAPPVAAGERPTADIRTVDPGALAALGIPLLAGRGFAETDQEETPPVVLVNRTLAKRIFGSENPIGRRLRVSWGLPGGRVGPVEIVGVAGDVRLSSLDAPARPTIYYAARQSPNSLMNLIVKADGDPTALLPTIRAELARLDPAIAIERPGTLEAAMASTLEGRKLPMLFLGPFAVAALLLAAVGISGVLAFSVRERTRELGIRLALGAQRSDVLRLVLGRAARLTAAGLAAGALVALLATRAMKSLLFGVEPTDPATFAAVALGVAAVALAASWRPARRAARIDPARALRNE